MDTVKGELYLPENKLHPSSNSVAVTEWDKILLGGKCLFHIGNGTSLLVHQDSVTKTLNSSIIGLGWGGRDISVDNQITQTLKD